MYLRFGTQITYRSCEIKSSPHRQGHVVGKYYEAGTSGNFIAYGD